MSSVFNKNVFMPNEFAEGDIKINNEHCQLNVAHVRFYVEQRLTVRIGHHSHTYTNKLIERTADNPPAAGQADWSQHMALNLAEIKYEVQKEKKKKGVTKPVSKEDQFMMSGVQAACNAKRISNHYFLCVLVEYDGCVCCVDLPDSRTPLTIIPIVNPACFGFEAPASGWAPYDLGMFNVDIRHCPDSD